MLSRFRAGVLHLNIPILPRKLHRMKTHFRTVLACALIALATILLPMKHALAVDRAVDPAEIKTVRGEMLKLSPQIPKSWSAGTRLRELQTVKPGRGTAAKGSLVPSSIVVRVGDKVLLEGRDYRLERDWGALGIGPQPGVTTDDYGER